MFVYAIRSGPYVKIGIADDLSRRLASLRGANPFPIFHVGKWEVAEARRVEIEAHEYLHFQHHHGEWFLTNDTMARAAVEYGITRAADPETPREWADPWEADHFGPPWPPQSPEHSIRRLIAPYEKAYRKFMAGDVRAKAEFIERHGKSFLRQIPA